MPPKKTSGKPAAKKAPVKRAKPVDDANEAAPSAKVERKAAPTPTPKPKVAERAKEVDEAALDEAPHKYAGKTVKATLLVGASLDAYGTSWMRGVPKDINDPEVIEQLMVDGCFSVEFLS